MNASVGLPDEGVGEDLLVGTGDGVEIGTTMVGRGTKLFTVFCSVVWCCFNFLVPFGSVLCGMAQLFYTRTGQSKSYIGVILHTLGEKPR